MLVGLVQCLLGQGGAANRHVGVRKPLAVVLCSKRYVVDSLATARLSATGSVK
jgi:hypothetical protein